MPAKTIKCIDKNVMHVMKERFLHHNISNIMLGLCGKENIYKEIIKITYRYYNNLYLSSLIYGSITSLNL